MIPDSIPVSRLLPRGTGRTLCLLVVFSLPMRSTDLSAAEPCAALTLAGELAAEGSHVQAAVEYRRLALEEDEPARRAGFYWAAAYQYLRDGRYDLTASLLDAAEDSSPTIVRPGLLLRAEAAAASGRNDEARFYLEDILNTANDEAYRTYAARKLAPILVADGKFDKARHVLDRAPLPCPEGLSAIDTYSRARDKSPVIGGLLGLIPGLGHAYAGEVDNALRSLLLNSLFIFAMTDTAGDEQWGAFAAVTFFELTWYTGSIYGGIDAAHRHNRERLQACISAIEGDTQFTPGIERLPAVSISFDF